MWCVNTNMLQIVPPPLQGNRRLLEVRSQPCLSKILLSRLFERKVACDDGRASKLKTQSSFQLAGLYRCTVQKDFPENHYNNVQSCQEVMVLSKLLLNCSLNLNFLSLEELSGNFQRLMSRNFHTYSVSLFVTLQYCTELLGQFKVYIFIYWTQFVCID